MLGKTQDLLQAVQDPQPHNPAASEFIQVKQIFTINMHSFNLLNACCFRKIYFDNVLNLWATSRNQTKPSFLLTTVTVIDDI
jgi:hypothetical protein